MKKLQNKVAFITGGSRGMGASIASRLASEGATVVFTHSGKNTAKASAVLRAIKANGSRGAALVANNEHPETILEAMESTMKEFGAIDILINNAGLGATGIQEEFTADDWKKVFDVNVFGVQRMTRAVLPFMKKQQQGLLMLISSLGARLAVPFQGPYSPSKWAAEALAESYRVEVSHLGIESCIVEPGAFPTPFIGSLLQPSEKERSADYGAMKDLPDTLMASVKGVFEANPEQSPDLVFKAIVELLKMPHGTRPIRTEVDRMFMGELVAPLNKQLEEANQKLYEAFQMPHLTNVKS